MYKFFSAFILASILFNSSPARAEIYYNCPTNPPRVTLKRIDNTTVVCKDRTQTMTAGFMDSITLYRFGEYEIPSFVVLLSIFEDNTKMISISEYKNSKKASFYIVGRKFQKWSLLNEPNPALVNKYAKFITIVLDAYESTLLEQTEF